MYDAVLPMIIDSFAGGGGASTGIELALGRSPDVAINHSGPALALHAANHPDTLHLNSNIWDVRPLEVTKGRPVGLLWASPDCKHFSKAKGGAPKDRNIRDLAWIVVDWAEQVKPDVILMENVEEFVTWGPLDEAGQPIKEFEGLTFADWKARLRKAGYKLDHRELRACDYGAPTIRKRFFFIARRDGRPIVWPKPTHGDPKSDAVRKGRLLPWRTAAECIDWSLPCPSIFDTSAEIMVKHGLRAVRPLAENTMARIARGMARYVIEADRPFVVNLTHGGRVEDLAEPLRTITAAHRGEKAVIAPSLTRFNGGATGSDLRDPAPTVTANSYIKRPGGCAPLGLLVPTLVQTGYGERPGQAPRALDICKPLGTVVAGGGKHAACAAFLAQHHGGPRMGSNAGHDAREPISTIAASGSHQTPISAFIAKYYGTGDGSPFTDPMHTVTVKSRMGHIEVSLVVPPFGHEHYARARAVADFLRAHGAWEGGEFVTLTIDGAEFVIVDIGMRMLTAAELFRAQGFPDDYVIDGVWDGLDTAAPSWRDFPKSTQVSCCGNSVCPPLAEALVRANCSHLVAAEPVSLFG